MMSKEWLRRRDRRKLQRHDAGFEDAWKRRHWDPNSPQSKTDPRWVVPFAHLEGRIRVPQTAVETTT